MTGELDAAEIKGLLDRLVGFDTQNPPGHEAEDRQPTLVGEGLQYPELRARGCVICCVDSHQCR